MIVNNLDDLYEKYKDHPKTAYVRKPRKGGKFGKGGKGEKHAVAARGMNLGIEDAFVFAACAADALEGNLPRLADYGRLRQAAHPPGRHRGRAVDTARPRQARRGGASAAAIRAVHDVVSSVGPRDEEPRDRARSRRRRRLRCVNFVYIRNALPVAIAWNGCVCVVACLLRRNV